MKRLIYKSAGNVQFEDVEVPEPGQGQVVVKVLGITTCPHWDLHLMDGIPMFPGRPLDYPFAPGKPGHEGMGEVVSVGKGVERLKAGCRVVAWRDTGRDDDQGWYAEYVAFDEVNLLEIPAPLRPEQIASLELAMCVQVSFDELIKQDLVKGKRFAVSGLGPAGLVAIQMAKAYGAAEVVGIDPMEPRRGEAEKMGFTSLLDPSDTSAFPEGRRAETAADTSLDCTGLKISIEYLMDRTRDAVSIFGVLRDEVSFGFSHWAGLSLIGYGNHNRGAAERALRLILDGSLDLEPLSTHTLPLDKYKDGVELLRSKEAIKVCYIP